MMYKFQFQLKIIYIYIYNYKKTLMTGFVLHGHIYIKYIAIVDIWLLQIIQKKNHHMDVINMCTYTHFLWGFYMSNTYNPHLCRECTQVKNLKHML